MHIKNSTTLSNNNFNCNRCGSCCRQLNLNEIYKNLDRGDGVCKYFNEESNLCSIYNKRPNYCNIDKMYEKFFYKRYTLKEYYKANYKSCKKLRKKLQKTKEE